MDFRGNLARLTTAVAATICFVTLLGVIFPWLVRWYQSYRASELLHRIEVAESQALSSPMQQLASLGIPAMESLILASASPRSEVALIARRVVEKKSTSWIVKSNADSQFDYATPAIKLARTLAEHVVKFDPAGKQWCENLVLRFIKRSDQLSADKAAELLEHCNRVLAVVPPRSPRLRTLAPIVPEKSFPSLQPLETPPIDLGTISVLGESTLIVKSSSSSNDTGATTNKATVDPQQRITEELSAQPLSRAPVSSWSSQWTRTPESSAEPTTYPGDRDAVRGDLGGTGVVEIPTPSQMHRRARQLREKSTAQLTRMVPNAKFYEAEILRAELHRRGFSAAEVDLLPRLFSPVENVRLRLIDELSDLPAVAARRWLHGLLKDESPEVRLRSLTALATTNDPQLFDLANKLATNDQSQRVAELASRIMQQLR